jgi:magnesium transporter
MKRSLTQEFFQIINPFETIRTKKVLHINPTVEAELVSEDSILTEYVYNEKDIKIIQNAKTTNLDFTPKANDKNCWLNIDILNKNTIEEVASIFKIHPLLIEDILSGDQRPKAEETDNIIFCILQMMYFNDTHKTLDTEQLSIVLGNNYVLTFQDEADKDLFNPLREKLKFSDSKVRQLGSDYLCYSIIDAIVDHYFIILEKLSEQIEILEEEVSRNKNDHYTMQKINSLRKDLILFKRNVSPVRELVNVFLRSENKLIQENNKRYFKDIYDHIIQANDLFENYRDVVGNIRDLYFNQTNLKMNHVMKFMAVVTTLLAPATVIGGVFGMNFDKIPYLHNVNGFWIATFLMVSIPIIMLFYFKKKGWY